ncbi:MAG: MiaB/RimO family radical SAM methylthiotransferase [Deltaproteobacteria bacterium]|nr:MiaB/RimO family radical SAM methylthiotransferase [Deltaproteobacteria bacterium]
MKVNKFTMLKIAFHTLGCRSNYADTIEIKFAVLERGAEIVDFNTPADVYVLNTCTITKGADKDAQRILRQLRKKQPTARIIVVGCLAECGFTQLAESSLVDAVVQKKDRWQLTDIIFGLRADTVPTFKVDLLNKPLSTLLKGPGEFVGTTQMRSRFHLRIQNGCENHCTYCIVPRTRGKFTSRSPERILEDIQFLTNLGYEEIVLTGTHIGAYGIDLGLNLFELLKKIESSKMPRIRLSSLDPNELSVDLINLLASSPILCNYLHVCFQSFSDKILKRMGRQYKLAEVAKMVFKAKSSIKNICIGSDVICGFPGESREDVNQAVKLFLDLPISYLHVFPYSERSGTSASKLDGVVPLVERKARADLWRSYSKQRRGEFLKSLCHEQLEIIVEQTREQQLFGISREYAGVRVDLAEQDLSALPAIGSRLNVMARTVNNEKEILLCDFLANQHAVFKHVKKT